MRIRNRLINHSQLTTTENEYGSSAHQSNRKPKLKSTTELEMLNNTNNSSINNKTINSITMKST